MLGEPKDKPDECNARLFIGDNYGDGTATFRCQLASEHEGRHQERFARKGGLATITWFTDERQKCDHGCEQWEHDHRDEAVQCPRDADDHEDSDCTFCHPGKPALTCAACGKTHYFDWGHKRSCPKRDPSVVDDDPFAGDPA